MDSPPHHTFQPMEKKFETYRKYNTFEIEILGIFFVLIVPFGLDNTIEDEFLEIVLQTGIYCFAIALFLCLVTRLSLHFWKTRLFDNVNPEIDEITPHLTHKLKKLFRHLFSVEITVFILICAGFLSTIIILYDFFNNISNNIFIIILSIIFLWTLIHLAKSIVIKLDI